MFHIVCSDVFIVFQRSALGGFIENCNEETVTLCLSKS